jgi:integrase
MPSAVNTSSNALAYLVSRSRIRNLNRVARSASSIVRLRACWASFVSGQGFFRQPWTKSDAGYRMVILPRFAVGMLLARKLVAADNLHDAIFASQRGTWLSPNNVRRQWRQARADTDLSWVTPHTFRKTVATLIKEETDTKSAAAQLGHSSEEVTDTYYIAKPVQAPDVSGILERLGANPDGLRSPTVHNDAQRRQTWLPYPVSGGFSGGGSKLHRQTSKP